MTCPICQAKNVSAGHIMGHGKSSAKSKAAAKNGKLGGRPRKVKAINKQTI